MRDKKDLFIASLLGGAIGDALGYTVEFMCLDKIKSKFGDQGITELDIDKATGKALISDDTQMTLFTADGMMWSYYSLSSSEIGCYVEGGIYQSYLRWYYTQNKRMPTDNDILWLKLQPHEKKDSILSYKELFSQRSPGNSCLSALGSGQMGTMEEPINDSKGCGGVMRVAPIGLFLHDEPEFAFKIAAEAAAITHGHPTGYLSAGALATIIAEIINGKSIIASTMIAIKMLKNYPNHKEILNAIEKAIVISKSDEKPSIAISKLGEGWIAEEALAIALYCALKEVDFKKALIMSINHDGDSDSTGAICGNILGARYGLNVIPKDWIANVELSSFIIDMAGRLCDLSDRSFS